VQDGWSRSFTFGNAIRPLPRKFGPDWRRSLSWPVGLPQGLYGPDAIFGRLDLGFFRKLGLISALLVPFSIMLSDFFDTMGTVVGIGGEAGFFDEHGKLLRLNRVLLVDALGVLWGPLLTAAVTRPTLKVRRASPKGAGQVSLPWS
jgi:xanthine/uracil/vitamin C permease (AzgA family)